MEKQELVTITNQIRKDILKMVHAAQSGHPGGSLSGVEIFTSLYFNHANIDAANVNEQVRDKVVLSKGHASPLLYATLMAKGLLDRNLATSFRQLNSILQGHPNMNYIPGVDMSTGSLGQGISCAVGMALANKYDNNSFRTYALLGDGELQEGQVWEAFMAASHYQLDNLCAIIDVNGLQIDGCVNDVMCVNPVGAKLAAFGWHVIEIDGHDFDQIDAAFNEAKATKNQPTAIVAKTIKGRGVSFMENQAGWHGVAPSDEQYELAVNELGGHE